MMTSSNGNVSRVTGPLCGEGQWQVALMFLWSAPVQTVLQTIETPVIWDAIALIMTSLWWAMGEWLYTIDEYGSNYLSMSYFQISHVSNSKSTYAEVNKRAFARIVDFVQWPVFVMSLNNEGQFPITSNSICMVCTYITKHNGDGNVMQRKGMNTLIGKI